MNEIVTSVIINGNSALAQRFYDKCPNVSSEWDNESDDNVHADGEDAGLTPPDALERLCLSSVKLVDDSFAKFSCFTNLSHLNLSFNKLTNISPIVSLTNLRYLDISHNKIESLEPLRTSQRVGYLTILRFCYNNITTLEPISGLTSLKELYFSHNEIDWFDMLYLHSLTSLNKLLKIDNPCNKKPKINDLVAALAHSLQAMDGEFLSDKFKDVNDRLDFLKTADGRIMFTQAKAIISSTHNNNDKLNPFNFAMASIHGNMNVKGAGVGKVPGKYLDASQVAAHLPLPQSLNSVYREALSIKEQEFQKSPTAVVGGKKHPSLLVSHPPLVQKFRVAHHRPTPHIALMPSADASQLQDIELSILGSQVIDRINNYDKSKGKGGKSSNTTGGNSDADMEEPNARKYDDESTDDKLVLYFGVPSSSSCGSGDGETQADYSSKQEAKYSQPIALSLSPRGEGFVRWSKLGAIGCSFEKNRLFCSHKSGSIAAIVDGNGSGSILDPRGRSVFVMNEQGTARVLDKQGHILASYTRNAADGSVISSVSQGDPGIELPGPNFNSANPPSPGGTLNAAASALPSQSWSFDGIQLEFIPTTWELIVKLQNERVSVQFSSISGGKLIKDREVKLKKPIVVGQTSAKLKREGGSYNRGRGVGMVVPALNSKPEPLNAITKARKDSRNEYVIASHNNGSDNDPSGEYSYEQPPIQSARRRNDDIINDKDFISHVTSHHQKVRSNVQNIISNLDEMLAQIGNKR